MTYFYCRVSTQDKQDVGRQLHLLKLKGIEADKIYSEKMTGTKINRPVWQECYASLGSGDTLVIESLSRIARSTRDLLDVVYELDKNGVNLISLKEAVDLSTPTGKMMVGMMSVIAQFERDLTAERVKEGLAATKARGTTLGKPIDKDKHDKIQRTVTAPDWHKNISRTARELGVAPRTVKRVLDTMVI